MTAPIGSRSAATGWKGGLVLLGFGLVLGTFLCEIAVRLAAPMPPAFSWLRSDGLVLHAPGMRATYFRQEFRTDVEINSFGLRGTEIAVEKPAGTLRVLVLGDSYAEGLQVPWADLLSTRLEKLLNRQPGLKVQVINAGVSGYGTADELLLLERLGWTLKPDLILVAFCVHNDVGDNLQRPLYDFSTGTPRRMEAPPPSAPAIAVLRVKEFLSRHSQLYQLIRDRTAAMRGSNLALKLGVRRKGGNATLRGGNASSGGLDHTSWFLDSEPVELARGLEYTGKLLGRIQEEAREHGAGVMAVWIPIRDQVSDRRWASLQEKLGLRSESRSRPQELLGAMAESIDLQAVDLLPTFRAAPDPEGLYFEIDGHWTSAGHELAARVLEPVLDAWRQASRPASSGQPVKRTSSRTRSPRPSKSRPGRGETAEPLGHAS